MILLYAVLALTIGLLLAAGVAERRRHLRNLRSIPIRIHVNGSRGKSSVTRLCAGALRAAGLAVVAKTTGSAARLVHTDGSETPIVRPFGLPNIDEQLKVVRAAVAEDPDALVLECMAVAPELQELSERQLVQSTIGVITNVREDHRDEMGPTLGHVARSLAGTMPDGGVCVTAERAFLPTLAAEAERRGSRLVSVEAESVGDDELEGFPYLVFKENVALALAVVRACGVSRHVALRGMREAAPDPGYLLVKRYGSEGKSMRFVNLFAANEPVSTLMGFELLLDQGAIELPVSTLINCRPDRIDRDRRIAEIVPRLGSRQVFLIGEPTRAARVGIPHGWECDVIDLGGRREAGDVAAEIFSALPAGAEATVIAIGNIHGQGEALIEFLDDHCEVETAIAYA